MFASRISVGVALSLVLVCGQAVGTPVGGAAQAGLSMLVPDAAQRTSASTAFAWQARDAGLLDRAVAVTERFVEVPGNRERQGKMVAKVRDRADMAHAAAVELTSGVADGLAVLRGGQAGFGVIWDRADERMAEARARLAPSLIEAFMDVDLHAFWLPEGWTEEQLAAVLMATGDYEYVEPDWLVYPAATTPNDPQFSQQWHHRAQNMNTVGAWDFVTGGPDVIVAICDTGVRKSHADLTTFVPGFNSATNLAEANGGDIDDINGHGTAVAGAAAARGNNAVGVAGVGWNFSIMPIRVTSNTNGTADLSNILQGARWASDNGAFAINCSYGGSNSSQANTSGNYIRQRDAVLVFASGNDGIQDQTSNWVNVTIVGATNSGNVVDSYSNYGPGIDVVAPGTNIRSTTRAGGYAFSTGTSLAAPLAAGTMALIRAANPSLTATQVEQVLKDTAIDIGAPGFDIFAGHGMVNAGAAVSTAMFGADLINLPFWEDFSSGTIGNLWREPVGTPEVNNAAGSMALNLNGTDSIRTVGLRTGFLLSGVGEISFDVQHRGVEAGKTLAVQYSDIIGTWQPLTTVTSNGTDTTEFRRVRVGMPLLAKHDGMKVRFVSQGADATDNWYIDDVRVAEFVRNTIPWQTGFENGVDLDFDWASAQATATTEAPNTPEGQFSARLSGAASMTSRPVDITSVTNLPYFRIRTLHTGVEAGKNLNIEYRDLLGNWQQLTSIVSDGSNQTRFTLHQITMPFAAFGTDLLVRLTANGTDASDVWYIDDIAITEEFIVDPPDCPQDIDGNGLVNFFDISAFLGLYNAQNPIADWDGNGLFNFFDISSYLTAYNAGCP